MHAAAGQCIQIDRQCRHQGLAFAGTHFRDPPFVEHHAADQLDIEVAHLQDALAALTNNGEGLGQDRGERLATGDAQFEFFGLGSQRSVVEILELRLQRIDLLHNTAVALEQALVTATENLGEKLGQHAADYLSSLASAGLVPGARAQTPALLPESEDLVLLARVRPAGKAPGALAQNLGSLSS